MMPLCARLCPPLRAAALALLALATSCQHAPQPASPAASAAPAAPRLEPGAAAKLRASTAGAWARRDDPATLHQLIDDYEQLFVADSSDAATAARLSQAYFIQAQIHRLAGARGPMQAALQRGTLVGEQALLLSSPALAERVHAGDPLEDALGVVGPSSMAALVWYTSNLGGWASTRGVTTVLFYRDRLRGMLERMLALDASYLDATPHRYWAVYLARAPAFAGGNLEQARVHFEHALAAAPNCYANAVAYAQYYAIPARNRQLFERLLRPVDAGRDAVAPDAAPEARLAQAQARLLLAQADRWF